MPPGGQRGTQLDQAPLCCVKHGGRSGEQRECPGLELDLRVPLLLGAGRAAGARESRDRGTGERGGAGPCWGPGSQRAQAAGAAANPLTPLGWLLLYQMSLCCCQQSRAVVNLCVMALSCTENKLCQPSACPVMMLCLSTQEAVYCAGRKPAPCSLLLLLSPLPAASVPPCAGKAVLMWLLSQPWQRGHLCPWHRGWHPAG